MRSRWGVGCNRGPSVKIELALDVLREPRLLQEVFANEKDNRLLRIPPWAVLKIGNAITEEVTLPGCPRP